MRVTKAEDGGLGAQGPWKPGTDGSSPGGENETMNKYLAGGLTTASGNPA